MDQNNPFDPNTLARLQGLLGQMGPSDADKADANKRMWLSAGLGMIANSYKPPSMALGIGGQTGLQSYNDELTRLAQQRASSIGSRTQIMQLQQRTQLMNDARNYFLYRKGAPPTSRGVQPQTIYLVLFEISARIMRQRVRSNLGCHRVSSDD